MGATLSNLRTHALSLLRIFTGLLFLEHGTGKFFGFPAVEMFKGFDVTPSLSPLWFSGVLEIVGGLFLILGLFTRPVAFIMSGFMAAAYFMVHEPKDFFPVRNGGELAILFCFVCLYLVASGAGAWSIDHALGKEK
ncbi:DoxX family protein [Methylovirgula sp. 4M-Z18]|uniref:DoxX family protein n=1 Tax=Methylovirgula sp. 4M-Z18 TaxID=2293567 RepID=UPI000E2EE6D8|nr:DoxX family protein [Methylovirgula sp. 4M-Z18]RFB79670.1 DoxX family protein [Methylovirgula sp. 4M-Z18]